MEVCVACTRPINGYRSPSGKFFTTPYPGSTFMQVPCGQCVNCRLNHSREWAIRCTHEAQMWDQNCFIMLTYNDENLPEGGTLVRKHLTDFSSVCVSTSPDELFVISPVVNTVLSSSARITPDPFQSRFRG